MGCDTTQILDENASNNSAQNNQEEEPKFNDFDELESN